MELSQRETAKKRGFADGYNDRQDGIKNYEEDGMIITYELIPNRKKTGEYPEYYYSYDAGATAAHAELEDEAREEKYLEQTRSELFWDELPWEREIGAEY